MGESPYKIICFQCQFEFITEKIQLECSRCKSRFLENIPLKRIPYIRTSTSFPTASVSRLGVNSRVQLFVSSYGFIQYQDQESAKFSYTVPIGRVRSKTDDFDESRRSWGAKADNLLSQTGRSLSQSGRSVRKQTILISTKSTRSWSKRTILFQLIFCIKADDPNLHFWYESRQS